MVDRTPDGEPDRSLLSGRPREISVNALPAGTRLFEFEIESVLGEGGFGIVYLAFDHSLHRHVAIKEYLPHAYAYREHTQTIRPRSEQYRATFEAGLKSFVQEARMLALFEHPALVKVHRFWEDHGTAYMAMSYYAGVTLRQWLKTDPRRATQASLETLIMPLFDAVELLHGKGCFHRDIAPDNIMVQPNGAPVLLDFGAARRVIGDMTQALTAVLKPGFAPVEQYAEESGLAQGPWTDVYAFSATLYAAISGKTPSASIARAFNDTVVPLHIDPPSGYDVEFLRGIDAGLALRPADRPQSIAAFRERLGLAQRHRQTAHDDATIRFTPPRGSAFSQTPSVPHDVESTMPPVSMPDLETVALPAAARAASAPGPGAAPQSATAPIQEPAPRSSTEIHPAAAAASAAVDGERPRRSTSWRFGSLIAALASGVAAVGLYVHYAGDASTDPRQDVPPKTVAALSKGAPLPPSVAAIERAQSQPPPEGAKMAAPAPTPALAIAVPAPSPAVEAPPAIRATPAKPEPKNAVAPIKEGAKAVAPSGDLSVRKSEPLAPSLKPASTPSAAQATAAPDSEDRAPAASGPRKGFVFAAPSETSASKDSREARVTLSRPPDPPAAKPKPQQAGVNAPSSIITDAKAQFERGKDYALGRGVTKDLAEAATWLKRAADQGYAPAQNDLGYAAETGRGIPQDDKEATRLYLLAAAQGDATAENNLGRTYEQGRGVRKNSVLAAEWYRKSADHGYAWGQKNLADMYENGRGVFRDETEAFKWYLKAAMQGNGLAQYHLGLMYESGRGVTRDLSEAASWFRKAALQGHAGASGRLAALERPIAK